MGKPFYLFCSLLYFGKRTEFFKKWWIEFDGDKEARRGEEEKAKENIKSR